MTRNLALFLAILPFAGCEELDPYLPKVHFQSFQVRDISFQEIDTDFVFAVENPNPVDIGLSSFSYGLELGGVDLLDGLNEDGFQLKANGSSELVLPIHLEFLEIWDAVEATRGEDFVPFGLDGHFGFDTPLGEVALPYREDGDFPALRTPKIQMQKLRLARFDLLTQSARLELDLGVENEHASTLFFDSFDYAVSFGGQQVVSGLIPSLGSVEGAVDGTLTLPIEIDLLQVGVSIVTAISTKSNLDVGLDAAFDVNTPFGVLPLAIDETGLLPIQ